MNSLSSACVENDDFSTAAQFVLLSKRGDASAAADFLRKTLAEVDGSALDMVALTNNLGFDLIGADLRTNTENGVRSLEAIRFIGDDIDNQTSTLVMLIPGDIHVVGHLIGKGGGEITKIELESGASIKIESNQILASNTIATPGTPPQTERIVVVSGPVVACVKAQRLLEKRLRSRLENDGIHREVLRIIVPNDFVRHLIGKGGSNISQLQHQTGIRIQVQAEQNMLPNQIGRAVTFQGHELGRSVAQYLVSRQITESPFRDWPQQSPPLSPSVSGTPVATTNAVAPSPEWVYFDSPNAQHYQQTPQQTASTTAPTQHQIPLALQQLKGHDIVADGGMNHASVVDGDNLETFSSIAKSVALAKEEDTDIMIQTTVPNAAVAFLIGRGGSTVSEMEQKSGARIKIAKSSGYGASDIDSGRILVIKGSTMAIRIAQSLVNARVEAYYLSYGQ